jgi:3-oxocholest-4-en-26-oyl-CoA dehydrogenase alpha subunit
MDLTYSAEQTALRNELRDYFAELMKPALRDELENEVHGGPCYKGVIRELGKRGLLGLGWPTEYGGQGRDAIDQYIFYDEAQRARVPVPFVALNTVAPTLMEFGTQEQKNAYLPGILAGEIDFAVGYSEADAGTDLASMRTRAVKQGDHWVIDGAKLWTSRGGTAEYVWLAARTDPDAPKHRGISIFVVDTRMPGFRATEIRTIAGYSTFATYYDGVAVPENDLVGAVNGGWKLITAQLNHERLALAAFNGLAFTLLDEVTRWALTPVGPRGSRRADLPWVQSALARCHALLSPLHLINAELSWKIGRGELSAADASVAKVYGTETVIEVYRLLMEVLGALATIREGRLQQLRGDLEWAYRRAVINTFGGGTNEVQREIIAAGALHTPRVPR